MHFRSLLHRCVLRTLTYWYNQGRLRIRCQKYKRAHNVDSASGFLYSDGDMKLIWMFTRHFFKTHDFDLAMGMKILLLFPNDAESRFQTNVLWPPSYDNTDNLWRWISKFTSTFSVSYAYKELHKSIIIQPLLYWNVSDFIVVDSMRIFVKLVALMLKPQILHATALNFT